MLIQSSHADFHCLHLWRLMLWRLKLPVCGLLDVLILYLVTASCKSGIINTIANTIQLHDIKQLNSYNCGPSTDHTTLYFVILYYPNSSAYQRQCATNTISSQTVIYYTVHHVIWCPVLFIMLYVHHTNRFLIQIFVHNTLLLTHFTISKGTM